MKLFIYIYFTFCFSTADKSLLSFENDEKNCDTNVIQMITEVDGNKYSYQVPNENWATTAIKDIAYYLRNNKFNEWDQRYYRDKPKDGDIVFFNKFPQPRLKLLHWKVHENCYKNFYECIRYLHNVVDAVPFRRIDDIITKLNNNKILQNESLLRNLDNECKDALLNSDKTGVPFDGPLEKFQWRISATYFMCWYTMLGTSALSMLGERCDNFASCLDPLSGAKNYDPRADDRQSFKCSLYSFCPDPCCPIKHVENINQCYEDKTNPCNFASTNISRFKCTLDRKNNQNFDDMMDNKWNTSCPCNHNGYEWKSKFGMCVDINECLLGLDNCNNETQDCLNFLGSYKCVCKWNYYLDHETKSCIHK